MVEADLHRDGGRHGLHPARGHRTPGRRRSPHLHHGTQAANHTQQGIQSENKYMCVYKHDI